MTSHPPSDRYLADRDSLLAGANSRPASVVVLAVIGIVLASVTILNNGVLGLLLVGSGKSRAMGPPSLRPWQFTDWSISLAFGVFLLCACVGTLLLRPWARKALLVYAGAYLPWLAVCIAVTIRWTLPIMKGRAAAEGRPFLLVHEEDQVDLYQLEVILTAVVAVYPLCVLWFLTRPRVRAAFAAATPAAGGHGPGGSGTPGDGRGAGPPAGAAGGGPPPLPPAG